MLDKAIEDDIVTKVEDIEEKFQRAFFESPVICACMYMYKGGELTLEQALKFMVITLHKQNKSMIDALVEINIRSPMYKQLLKESDNAEK